MRALMLAGAIGFVTALVLAGCGGGADIQVEQTQTQAPPPVLCYPTDPAPIPEVDRTCPNNWTRDGRECMVCTHLTSCEWLNPESGYCADRRYGCDDPLCVFGGAQVSRAGFARKAPPSVWCSACGQPLAWHRTSTDVEVTSRATTITTILVMRDLSGVMFVCAVKFDTQLRGQIDAVRVEGRLET